MKATYSSWAIDKEEYHEIKKPKKGTVSLFVSNGRRTFTLDDRGSVFVSKKTSNPFLRGFLFAVFLMIATWFGGYYYDVRYSLSTFNYDQPTPQKCGGWQNRWAEMMGSGNSWHCPEATWSEINRWCDPAMSWDWDYNEKNSQQLDLWFYKIS